jgi:hypothetical protein
MAFPTAGHVSTSAVVSNQYAHSPRFPTLPGRLPLHVNQNNNNNDVQAASGVDLRMTMLPAKLKQAGYSTHMTGCVFMLRPKDSFPFPGPLSLQQTLGLIDNCRPPTANGTLELAARPIFPSTAALTPILAS